MKSRLGSAALALALMAGASMAWSQRIYTCIDSKGRRLTSDRPIPECTDREQKELNSSGTVRRTVGPTMTATERAVFEEQERKANEERMRASEEKRRERAMLSRYPTQAAHDAERVKALNAVQEVILAAHKRTAELQTQRKRIDEEVEFYRKDPSKMPSKLKRQIEENDEHMAGQQRFLDNQEEEKQRVNARFNEELVRLKLLWSQMRAAQAAAGVPAASAPRGTP